MVSVRRNCGGQKVKTRQTKQVVIVLLFAHTIHFQRWSARSTFKCPFSDKNCQYDQSQAYSKNIQLEKNPKMVVSVLGFGQRKRSQLDNLSLFSLSLFFSQKKSPLDSSASQLYIISQNASGLYILGLGLDLPNAYPIKTLLEGLTLRCELYGYCSWSFPH